MSASRRSPNVTFSVYQKPGGETLMHIKRHTAIVDIPVADQAHVNPAGTHNFFGSTLAEPDWSRDLPPQAR
jgi:hypothetical protein